MKPAEQWPVTALSMDLTENCSLRCDYCFCGEKTTADMDESVARDTVDWLISKDVSGNATDLQIDLWGGEPTMRWPFARELIAYGNTRAAQEGKRIRWNMTTNGMHFDARLADDARLAGVTFMLSLDGTRETQDRYRPTRGGGSSYDVITSNLPNMLRVQPILRVRMTIRESNVDSMYRDVLALYDLGIPQISHCLAHETLWTHESMAELERQMRLIGDWYVERKRSGDRKLWVKFIHEGIGRLLYPRPLQYFCGAGRSYLGVSVHGVIYPCHRFHEFSDTRSWQEQPWALGTVTGGVMRPEIRQRFIDAKHQQYCRGCNLAAAGACTGSCYAVNAIKSGGDIAVPAHSQCAEQQVIYGVAQDVYARLVGVPAFKGTLARAARDRFHSHSASLCVEPRMEPAIDVIQAAAAGTTAEIEVLSAAVRAISEAVSAIQEVATTGISERQWRMALLDAMTPNIQVK